MPSNCASEAKGGALLSSGYLSEDRQLHLTASNRKKEFDGEHPVQKIVLTAFLSPFIHLSYRFFPHNPQSIAEVCLHLWREIRACACARFFFSSTL
jgi:hypothetical protein